MSTIIKFELKELRRLANDKKSCVIEKRIKQKMALQPWCLGNLKESIKNLLDYKIGKFDKEHNGILLSYKNLRVLQNVGTIRNDNSDINFEIQADYFIFQPHVGATLRGIVNKKSVTHLGVIVHKVFNVVITRPTEEPGAKWIGSGIQEGQEVVFRIVVLDLFGALPYIRGELDERFLPGTEGDDIVQENRLEPINISYVNFERTKPTAHKPSGDATPVRPLKPEKVRTPNKNNKSVTEAISNGRSVKAALEEAEELVDKPKTKRQKGTSQNETPTKQSKKTKKNQEAH